jgi:8-oxo-dGTP diphosphatase
MTRPEHDPTKRRPHGPEDVWVDGPHGRFWGRVGAAGLLVVDGAGAVLLQERATWSHFGGTWAMPGGARKAGETAAQAALREADEEAGVPSQSVEVFDEHVRDLGYWSYTTVLARVVTPFDVLVGDAESVSLRWVPVAEVETLPLHPAFAEDWPTLRGLIAGA